MCGPVFLLVLPCGDPFYDTVNSRNHASTETYFYNRTPLQWLHFPVQLALFLSQVRSYSSPREMLFYIDLIHCFHRSLVASPVCSTLCPLQCGGFLFLSCFPRHLLLCCLFHARRFSLQHSAVSASWLVLWVEWVWRGPIPCPFLKCKYSYCGWFLTSSMMSLSAGLGIGMHNWFSAAGLCCLQHTPVSISMEVLHSCLTSPAKF